MEESTSNIIANYLIEKLNQKNIDSSKIYLKSAIASNDQIIDMFNNINISDNIILLSPVYFDSLPYIVVRAMELIYKYRYSTEISMPYFYSIINCGFPEANNTELAIAISRIFAIASNFKWKGGIGFSMGPIINKSSKQNDVKLRENIVKILDKLVNIIAERNSIPDDVVKLASKPLMPVWLYNFLVNRHWKKMAKKYGTKSYLERAIYQ
jgi:hypothetical protein